MTTLITKSEAVLKRVTFITGAVVYKGDTVQGMEGMEVHLPNWLYQEMGEPQEVTLTCVPGDTLGPDKKSTITVSTDETDQVAGQTRVPRAD